MIAPTPRHFTQRRQEHVIFFIVDGPKYATIKGANEAAGVRHDTKHGLYNARVTVTAAINAIIFRKTSHIPNVWYIRSHIFTNEYTTMLVVYQPGGLFWRLAARPLSVPSALVLFGQQLKKLRESRDLSQERLAELCEFNRHYIGRIERAERVISFEYMMRIAYALAVPPAELYKLIPVPKRLPKKGEYKGEKDGNAKRKQP